MFNRRRFIQFSVTSAMLKANATTQQPKIFERVFQPLKFETGMIPEFPLDFIAPGEEKKYSAFAYYHKNLEKFIGGDYILVPTPFSNKNPAIDYDYGATLLVAGLDRNILVFDEKCDGNYVSKRLQALLSTTIKRNYSRKTKRGLTDIFIEEGSFVENPLDKINVHRVDSETWNKIIKLYSDFPDICKHNKRLNNKKNLIIGVSIIVPDFVKPIMSNGDYGIAVLKNRNIIIGIY